MTWGEEGGVVEGALMEGAQSSTRAVISFDRRSPVGVRNKKQKKSYSALRGRRPAGAIGGFRGQIEVLYKI
jgi:hypothetical protein